MTSGYSIAFAGLRARDLIVLVALRAHAREVLLPALYCGEVAAALETAGVRHRCDDVGDDLGARSEDIIKRLTPNTDLVISVHWFGLNRPPPPLPGSVDVLEDACHAARTLRSIGVRRDNMVVYSPRKEFGWPLGGILEGGQFGDGGCDTLRARWRAHPWEVSVAAGRAVTSTLFSHLGTLMPDPGHAVLSHLPLRSKKRDRAIAVLREAGFAAWYWRQPPPGTRTGQFPRWRSLDRDLFLVPLPNGVDTERLVTILSTVPLRRFSGPRRG